MNDSPHTTSNPHKYSLWIYLLIALMVTGIFFVPLVLRGLEMWSDSYFYLSGGRNILAGNGFRSGCGAALAPITHWPPGYSALIAGALSLESAWQPALQYLSVINFIICAGLLAILVYRLRVDRLTGCLFIVAILFQHFILRWGASALSESASWIWLLLAELLVLSLIRRSSERTYGIIVLLGLVLVSGFLTRYAFAGIITSTGLFFLLRFWAKRDVVILRQLLLLVLVVSFGCGLLIVRNMMLAGSAAESAGGDPRVFRNAYYSFLQFWEVFFLFRPGSLATALPIFILVPLFVYRLHVNIKKACDLPLFIAFNCCILLGYTVTIIVLRTAADAITLDSRMFSILVFPFIFVLADIKPVWARNLTALTLIALSALKYKSLLHADTMYGKVFGYSVYQRSLTLLPQNTVYTFDPEIFLMGAEQCIDGNIRLLDQSVVDKGLQPGEAMVIFFNTYKFDRYKKLYEQVKTNPGYRTESFNDGLVLYPPTR